jgi:hypothetical protein
MNSVAALVTPHNTEGAAAWYHLTMNSAAALVTPHNTEGAAAYLLINNPELDPFDGFTAEERQDSRTLIIGAVLATDLAHHAKLLAEFKSLVSSPLHTNPLSEHAAAEYHQSANFKATCMKLAIKCADISNPARPWKMYANWIPKVMSEFWNQGDLERLQGFPISPFHDRHACDVNKCQMGFIRFIVCPLYEAFTGLIIGAKESMDCLVANTAEIARRQEANDSSVFVDIPISKHNNEKPHPSCTAEIIKKQYAIESSAYQNFAYLDTLVSDGMPAVAQCAFFDRNLYSRMPLDPTHVRLKRTCV